MTFQFAATFVPIDVTHLPNIEKRKTGQYKVYASRRRQVCRNETIACCDVGIRSTAIDVNVIYIPNRERENLEQHISSRIRRTNSHASWDDLRVATLVYLRACLLRWISF